MIGLILIAAGVAGAAYGGINYMNLQDAVGNRVVKALGGTTEAEKQALIFLIGGAAAQPADHRAMQARARQLVSHIGRQRGDALRIEIHTRFPEGGR